MKQKFVKKSFRVLRQSLLDFAKKNGVSSKDDIDMLVRAERVLLMCALQHDVKLNKCNFDAYYEEVI
jgi:hypothetical protein